MGNRTVSKLRRNMLLKGGLDRAYGKRAVQKIVFRVFLYTLIFGLSFTMLYPLIKVLPAVFGDFATLDDPNVVWIPRKLSVLSFTAAIRIGFGNGTAVLLSLLYSAVVAGIQIFSSALAGYSLGRVRFPMRSLFMVLVVVTIVVPPQTLLIPQYLRFQKFDIFGIFTLLTGEPLNLLNQPYTLYLLAATGFGIKQGIFIFIFRQFFKGLPIELEEAAFIDGCGFYRTFFRISQPNAMPALVTALSLAFVWNYGDPYYTGYFHPGGPYIASQLSRVFFSADIPRMLENISRWYGIPYTTVFTFDAIKYAAGLLYILPILLFFFIAQRRLVENFEQSGIVG